jgi:DNA polymerase family A
VTYPCSFISTNSLSLTVPPRSRGPSKSLEIIFKYYVANRKHSYKCFKLQSRAIGYWCVLTVYGWRQFSTIWYLKTKETSRRIRIDGHSNKPKVDSSARSNCCHVWTQDIADRYWYRHKPIIDKHDHSVCCLLTYLSGDANQKRPTSGVRPLSIPRGGYFILQLHDELIYEVNASDVRDVCCLIKQNMESAMKLSVKLPVKLRTGSSWGSMTDTDLWCSFLEADRVVSVYLFSSFNCEKIVVISERITVMIRVYADLNW